VSKRSNRRNNRKPSSQPASTSSQPKSTSSQAKSPSSSSKSASSQPKKERGIFLATFLILVIASGIIQAVLYVAQRRQEAELTMPIILVLGIVHATLNVIAAIGIWNWKKWGVYLYIGSSVLGVIIGVIAVGPIAFFSMLLPVILLGYLIAAKWSWFE
jgi:hypothetical protein